MYIGGILMSGTALTGQTSNADIRLEPNGSGNVVVDGAVQLTASAKNVTGTIQWNGTNFQGYNGTSWNNMDVVTPASGITGAIQISDGAEGFTDDGSVFYWDLTNNRLGIGTTSPTSELNVVGTATVSSGLVVDTTTLFVDSSTNRVGVGTTGPSVALDIATGGSNLTGLKVTGSTGKASAKVLDDTGSYGVMIFSDSTTNDRAGIYGNDELIIATGSDLDPSNPTYLNGFIKINEFGDVGINRAAPSGSFHIVTDTNQKHLIIDANATQTSNIVEIRNSSTTPLTVIDEVGKIGIGDSNPTAGLQSTYPGDIVHLQVEAHSTQTSDIVKVLKSNSNPYLIVNETGAVGLGTTDPLVRLDVSATSDVIAAAIRANPTSQTQDLMRFFDQYGNAKVSFTSSGSIVLDSYTTASRPTAGRTGRIVYDTTEGKPVFDNGSTWQIISTSSGTVESYGTALVRFVTASIANGGTPAEDNDVGDWISSITDTSTGDMIINVRAGVFSNHPHCVCNDNSNGGSAYTCHAYENSSKTAIRVETTVGGGSTNADIPYAIICMAIQ